MDLTRIAAAATLALGISSASAQQYPAHPVRIFVPFAAGGGLDVFVRPLAAELASRWAQPVIVENRAGAGGNLGAEAVAKSPPDGHVLLATINQTFAANRYLYKSLPYDADRSFIPISLMVQYDMLLVAHASVRAADLRELVALARQGKGKLAYGSFGVGSQAQLAFEMLNKKEGLDLLHVPYNGIGPVMRALTAGEVPLATGSVAVAGELIRSGKLKALAIMGKQRAPQLPGVPTSAELGYPYLLQWIWFGLFAPAGTPEAIVEKIGADVRAVLKTREFSERHAISKGMGVVASMPQDLSAAIREETALVGEMIRAAGIRPE
ncbi:MAG: tripartite tricarboxylate transporter substrate binding protein [Burkholderiales bacterium]|nr:tripartite tricarboxylate transporter substrate binding protein [Burkholderiales bacterium]